MGSVKNIMSTYLDIIVNNKIDQKVVEIFSSPHYALVEHSIIAPFFLLKG